MDTRVSTRSTGGRVEENRNAHAENMQSGNIRAGKIKLFTQHVRTPATSSGNRLLFLLHLRFLSSSLTFSSTAMCSLWRVFLFFVGFFVPSYSSVLTPLSSSVPL